MRLLFSWICPKTAKKVLPFGPFVEFVYNILGVFEITSNDLVNYSDLLRVIEYHAHLKGEVGEVMHPNALRLLYKWLPEEEVATNVQDLDEEITQEEKAEGIMTRSKVRAA